MFQFAIPGCKPDPPRRVCSKMIHLTYAALYDDELDFDAVVGAAARMLRRLACVESGAARTLQAAADRRLASRDWPEFRP